MGIEMHAASDELFNTLADPTRRAIFERLLRRTKRAGADKHIGRLAAGRVQASRRS
jgi:hypothetical protein